MSGSGNETFDRDHARGAAANDADAGERSRKSTPEGEIRSQRGRPDEIDAETVARGHEPRDAAVRPIAWALLGLAGGVSVAAGAVLLLLGFYARLEPLSTATSTQRTTLVPPPPRLERQEGEDRPGLEREARDWLEASGPSPDEPGRVRVPIVDAMQLLAERGWPDPDDGSRPAARPSEAVPADARVPTNRNGGAGR